MGYRKHLHEVKEMLQPQQEEPLRGLRRSIDEALEQRTELGTVRFLDYTLRDTLWLTSPNEQQVIRLSVDAEGNIELWQYRGEVK